MSERTSEWPMGPVLTSQILGDLKKERRNQMTVEASTFSAQRHRRATKQSAESLLVVSRAAAIIVVRAAVVIDVVTRAAAVVIFADAAVVVVIVVVVVILLVRHSRGGELISLQLVLFHCRRPELVLRVKDRSFQPGYR